MVSLFSTMSLFWLGVAQAAPFCWVSDTDEDQLVRVDLGANGGLGEEVVVQEYAAGIPYGVLAMDPSTGLLYGADPVTFEVGTIDPETGDFSVVAGPLAATFRDDPAPFESLGGMAFDPVGGLLYACGTAAGPRNPVIVPWNVATNELVDGPSGLGFWEVSGSDDCGGLSVDDSDHLFAMMLDGGSVRLSTYLLSTTAFDGEVSWPAGTGTGRLTMNADGERLVLTNGSPARIDVYDSATVTFTERAALSGSSYSGIACTTTGLDSDGDGVTDGDELTAGSNPYDSDNDGVSDADDLCEGFDDSADANDDGTPDGCDETFDGDEDGLSDLAESLGADGVASTGDETDPADADTDDDGLTDGDELLTYFTNPLLLDTDTDGLTDGLELGVTVAGADTDTGVFVADVDPLSTTDPLSSDTDDDGLLDGAEDANQDGQFTLDLSTAGPDNETDPNNADTDDDGVSDGDEGGASGADFDGDGFADALDADGDDDGLNDREEDETTGTSRDDDDSDDDGVLDGNEFDAGLNPLSTDSDDDGLFDGVELGLVEPEGRDTDGAVFVADADPSSTTDPLNPDTDDDGLLDGDEDLDGDGAYEPDADGTENDETDPTLADSDADGVDDAAEGGAGGPDLDGDGVIDAVDPDGDGDGLDDLLEDTKWSTGRDDADSDDDGVPDGDEVSLYGSTPTLWDTDGDGLSDGQEAGITEPALGTDSSVFVADADPTSTTSLVLADTDADGVPDGVEDSNLDGAFAGDVAGVDEDETDPNLADTDGDGLSDGEEGADTKRDTDGDETIDALDLDSDSDGLSDVDEAADAGLDPFDDDSDDDGILDGNEGPLGLNPTLWDTDADGLSDGLELGISPQGTGTDDAVYVADTDPGTTTDPLNPDSDGDGLLDGDEDVNGDGAFDSDLDGLADDETDPNNPDSDGDGLTDGEEGGPGDLDADGDGTIDALDPDPGSTGTGTGTGMDTGDTGESDDGPDNRGQYVGGACLGCASSGEVTGWWLWSGWLAAFLVRRREGGAA